MNNIGSILFKIIIILVLTTIVFCTFSNYYVYAMEIDPGLYKPDPGEVDQTSEEVLKRIGTTVIWPIRVVGSFISVISGYSLNLKSFGYQSVLNCLRYGGCSA